MSASRLVALLALALLLSSAISGPAAAASTAPKEWRQLQVFTATQPGLNERIFTIFPDQDYRRYILMAWDTEGFEAGLGAFQINRAGLAEVTCRGVVAALPIGVNMVCEDLLPNHSYRILFTTTDPTIQIRLFGYD